MEKLKEESSNPIGDHILEAIKLVESLHADVKLKLKRQAQENLLNSKQLN